MGRGKSCNMGGCKRTYVAPCGKVISAIPDRLQGKISIHDKVCPICSKQEKKFISKNYEFEGHLNATNLQGGTSYTKDRPAIMRGQDKDGEMYEILATGDASTNVFWEERDEQAREGCRDRLEDVPVFPLIDEETRFALDKKYQHLQRLTMTKFCREKDIDMYGGEDVFVKYGDIMYKYYPHKVHLKPEIGGASFNITHKDTEKLILSENYEFVGCELVKTETTGSITKGMKKNMKKSRDSAIKLLDLCWSWYENNNNGYDAVLEQVKTCVIPNIKYRANIGTSEEQVANSIGDCVKATFNKLKELSDKFGDEHFVSKTLVCPTTRSNNPLEEFVVHHVVENTKLNLVMDFSNRRECCVDTQEYIDTCNPTPIKMERVGERMSEWRTKTKGWMVANNLPIDNFHDGCVWLMMEMLHSLEMERENKHFTADLDMDFFTNWMKEIALQGWDDWYKQFMVEWSIMEQSTSVF